MIDAMVNTKIQVTNAALSAQLGAIPLVVPIKAQVPVALGSLLGVLNGQPLPLNFMQALMASLPAGVPVVGGGSLNGNLAIRTAPMAPASPLLDQCRMLVGAAAPAAN
jgi:hypothetical protein